MRACRTEQIMVRLDAVRKRWRDLPEDPSVIKAPPGEVWGSSGSSTRNRGRLYIRYMVE